MRPVWLPRAAGILCLAASACGDSGSGQAELDIPRPACPDQVNASFEFADYVYEPGHYVIGYYDDRPFHRVFVELEDGCTLTEICNEGDAPSPCSQCTEGEACVDGTCVPAPITLDIGVVRISGTEPELSLSPAPDNHYGYGGEPPLYAPGAQITVRGAGGDTGIDAFDVSVLGVPPLTVPSSVLTATSGQDLEVAWDPPEPPVGARVHFETVTHDGWDSVYVDCWSDDTGRLTVPGATVDRIIRGSFVGARLTRWTLGTTECEHGCAVLTTSSAIDMDIQTE